MSFVLAQPQPGVPVQEVCDRITQQTGLQALTRHQFIWKTIWYYLEKTGIPINFGITVLLGFIVGTAISGQTFYLFTIENLKQFGALKAMGTSNWRIVGMVLLQALQVGFIGYCLGVGGAALLLVTGAAVLVITLLASLLCVRKVITVEPAIVFKG